jgi:hypothetical protein
MAIASIGTRGTAVSGASTTTIARAPTATVAVGRCLLAHFATRENVAISTVTDAAGNTWEFLGRFSHVGTGDAHSEVWLCNVTTQLTTGTTITATFGSAVIDKCMALWEYSVGAGNALRTVEPVVGNQVNAANGFGSAAFAGLASQQRLYFRSGSKRANSTTTITATSGFTTHALNIRSRNSGTLAIVLRAEHLIATNTGTTSNPTMAVSGNTAALFVALEEYTPPAAQDLTPALFTNANTFYTHTVTVGPVTLTPALYENEQVFYSPTVDQPAGTQDLLPGLYTNNQTFYGPTVAATYTLTPARYDNAQTFYAATVAAGAVNLTPARYDNANTFYTASVAAGAVNLTPARYDNANTFYAATLAVGAATLLPARLDNVNVFYGPTVTTTAAGLVQNTRFDNANTFYAATVSPGGVTISPARVNGFQSFYEPTVTPGAVTLTPARYDNGQTFYAATVNSNAIVSPPYYENPNQFFAASIATAASILPPYYENQQEFYEAEVKTGGQDVVVPLVENTNEFYGGLITQFITFQDWVEPGWVEPGWVEWPYFNQNQFFSTTLTPKNELFPATIGSVSVVYPPKMFAPQYFTIAELEEICAWLQYSGCAKAKKAPIYLFDD